MTLRAFLTRLIWICLLPLLGLSAWLAVDHVRDVQASSESAAERLARNVATAIDHDLGGRIGALRVLAASRLADDPADWSRLYEEAQGFRRNFGIDVVFAGLDGRAHFHTARPRAETLPEMPRPAGRSAVALAMSTGAPAVGDLFHGPVLEQPVVAIAAPGIRDGRTTFVMVGVVPVQVFEERLRDFTRPPGWTVALRDSQGETIARRTADATAEVDAGRTTFEAKLAAAPWTVALDVPHADYLAPVASATVAMALALVGATLAGVLGGAWASRRLARSVRALAAPVAAPVPEIAIEEIATARRQLVESTRALGLREAQLSSIFDTASDAILTVDASQTVVVANSAAARMFGCAIDEMVGSPLERFIPPRHRDRHHAHMQAFGETGASVRWMGDGAVELSALRAGGQEFPIEASISRVDVDGRRLYTAILRDITERRRAERELHASKAKLEAALASMTDAVAIVGADGVQRRRQRRPPLQWGWGQGCWSRCGRLGVRRQSRPRAAPCAARR